MGGGETDTDGIDPPATLREQGWVALAERVFSLVSVSRHRIHRLDECNVFGWHFVLVMVTAWVCDISKKEEDGRLREFFGGGGRFCIIHHHDPPTPSWARDFGENPLFVLPCLGGPCIRLTVGPSSAKPGMLHEPHAHAGGARSLEIAAPPAACRKLCAASSFIYQEKRQSSQLLRLSGESNQDERQKHLSLTTPSNQAGAVVGHRVYRVHATPRYARNTAP